MAKISIPESRFEERRNHFLQIIAELGLENYIVLNPRSIYYLTGFSLIPTERPFMLVFKKSDVNFFVPELEKIHVEEECGSFTSQIGSYFEYPSK